ncbi:hypothetical protein HYS31_05655 [Candidatus Woesearchaeota archaeon]|nr:hypothetical protein [Candidatus Woesearchaeota archaeon]
MGLEEKISGQSDTRGEHFLDIIQRSSIYGAIYFAAKTTAAALGGMYGYYSASTSGLGAGYKALYTFAGAATAYVATKLLLVPSKIKEAYRNTVSLFKGIFGESSPVPAR